MSISVESGEHPILENQHRMHFKRKVIMPGKLVHKLEWRFYKRSVKGRSRPRKTVNRIGNRMRVGGSFSRHASMHDEHGEADYKGIDSALRNKLRGLFRLYQKERSLFRMSQ